MSLTQNYRVAKNKKTTTKKQTNKKQNNTKKTKTKTKKKKTNKNAGVSDLTQSQSMWMEVFCTVDAYIHFISCDQY